MDTSLKGSCKFFISFWLVVLCNSTLDVLFIFLCFFHSDAPYLAYSLVPFARLPRWASSLWAFGSCWRESFKKEWGKSAAFPFAPVQGKRRNVSLETFQSILSNNPFIKLPMQGVTTDLKWAAQVKDLMEEDAAAKLTAQPDFYFFWYVTECILVGH